MDQDKKTVASEAARLSKKIDNGIWKIYYRPVFLGAFNQK